MINIVNKLFGSIKSNSLKKYASFVEKVNKLEEIISQLSDLLHVSQNLQLKLLKKFLLKKVRKKLF